MTAAMAIRDGVIVGGGFYGAAIALYLRRQRGFGRVTLIEREPRLLQRASLRNQARAHNGYHYPRSFSTAYRSRINLQRFSREYSVAISTSFQKLYAIARRNSKVTARQFEKFCSEIGASLRAAPGGLSALFNPALIEAVYLTEEAAFDADLLRRGLEHALHDHGVEVLLGTKALGLSEAPARTLQVAVEDAARGRASLTTRWLFNCTYSGLNQLMGPSEATVRSRLKHELTEMALIELPASLAGLAVTVMDGPFFSVMPYPTRQAHTLSHVRYTPHLSWADEPGVDPYARLDTYRPMSRFDRMVRDAARYLPALGTARQIDSVYEIKTVLTRNEIDDGRPILLERHAVHPNVFSVLGGKIDNIYDILGRLDAELLLPGQQTAAQLQGTVHE